MTSAPSTGSPSWVALRSMTTKSPSAAGALDVVEGGEPLTQRLDLLLDVVVGELDVLDLGLEAVVGGQRDLGLDVDLGGELEGLVVLELGDLDLGLGQRLEGVLLERLDVLLRDDLVDRLVEDRAAADLAVDHRRRDLAAAEAGDVDLLGDLLVRRVEARLELLEGHLDGQLGPGRAQGLDGALHRWSPCVGGGAGVVQVLGAGRPGAAEPRRTSGRQDSNLRSPAPKAGALATTLRPAKRASGRALPRPLDPLGADDGNRTRVASLEDWGSTIELHPRAHGAGRRELCGCHGATPRGVAPQPRRPPRRARSAAARPAAAPGRRCGSRARRSAAAPRPRTRPRSSCSAWPSIRSMPSPMSRCGVSTSPSV